MPKYLDMHGLETLTGDIEATYLRKNKRGAANGVASLDSNGKVPVSQIPGGAGGTSDYTDLDNKPQINGTTLTGNKTTANLGIHDIPSGGTTGQVLAKSSDNNYAVQWVNQQGGGGGTTDYADLDNKPQINGTTLTGNKTTANLGIHDVPSGGSTGQVLAKHSGTDHDVEWATPADPTSVIDDNAGPFTTDKTFSASKLWSDLGGKVDKTGAQFNDISMGRVPNSTVGNQSIAIGTSDNPNQGAIASGDNSVAVGTYVQATGDRAIAIGSTTQATGVNATAIGGSVTASGDYSFAHGSSTSAQGMNSTAEGYGTTASGIASHAGGSQTFAIGDYSHSQGYSTRAEGYASSVEGNGTVAKGANSSVSGMYNVPDSYANWPDWAPNTYYAAGAKVHLQDEESGETRGEYFVCNTPHTSGTAWITYSFYWDSDNGKMNYAQIVGNGSNYLQQSNAYTLDWDGNGSYAGDVTINKGTAEEVSVSELKTEIVNRPEVKESDKTGVDFDLSDEDGNVILRLKDGHVETKNFDSSNIGKDSLRSGADLDISDENGNVILRLKDGGIETKYFDSKYFKNPIEAYSVSATYNRSSINTMTISHPFKKGEEIFFHLDDGNRYDAYGRYATYYEGNKAVTGNRRGSNGYVRHVITEDCESVGITIASGEYTDGVYLTLWVYKINGKIEPKIVTVKADGTGMFQTIKAAVDSITDANHLTNPYVIEVYPGTYDTLEGFTDEEIASAEETPYTQDTMVGVKLTDGISMKGIGRPDEIILTAYLNSDDWNSTIRGNISTLNTEGEMSLENLTIVGNNIRYCVHDDFRNPANSHDKRILRNLKFKGTKLSYYPLMTTYGAGMTAPVDYLIENCDFGFDLGIHTNGGLPYGCTIEVNNCSGNRFRIGDYASAEGDAVCRWIINNCNFQSLKVNRNDQTLSSHALITGVGNENSMVVSAIPDLYRLGMIDLAPVGLTTGKAVSRQSSGMQFETTADLNKVHGVVIGSDDTYSYVQKCGYVSSALLGLTGLAVGDYITVNSSGSVATGGTASNAIGKVAMIDENSNAQIKLML